MGGFLHAPGQATVFTIMDSNSRYWQIFVVAYDIPKTTFAFRAGTNIFGKRPFALMSAPATSQPMLAYRTVLHWYALTGRAREPSAKAVVEKKVPWGCKPGLLGRERMKWENTGRKQ